MNMAESSSYDYEEILLKDIEDSKVKCVLVLEHFTFEKSQVRIVLYAFYCPQKNGFFADSVLFKIKSAGFFIQELYLVRKNVLMCRILNDNTFFMFINNTLESRFMGIFKLNYKFLSVT